MRQIMHLIIVLLLLLTLDIGEKSAEAVGVAYNFIHDLLQNNIAGAPSLHEKTEWNFDPDVGKKRRAIYELENGRRGELAIARIGMGVGYSGPWGSPSQNDKPVVAH